MGLSPGTRLGSLEIHDLIGAGGMGEVYRATDPELKRDVAVKVLPHALTDDDQRLARFKREAELLAALNHPNIAHIYGLERSSGTTAIVMELVEGPTLAERLATAGALPVDEALEIGFQLIDALEVAHEHGIVHRDLKPANIAVQPDGRVKVLDFGIAKALGDVSGAAGSLATTQPPTLLTRPGFALGTTAYMSPEQARGKPVDQRTDIWAFGCILYEMLTGRAAFAGEDATSTLARVLERETDLSTLPGGLPPAVRKALTLCLVKDARERVADVRDVRLVLKGTFGEAPARRAPWRSVAAAVGAAALGGLLVWSFEPRSGVDPPPMAPVHTQIEVAEGQHLSTLPNIEEPAGLQRPSRTSMAFSPDGTRLVYTAGDGKVTRLYVRRLDRSRAVALAGTEGASSPFFSPDGASIGFFVGTELKRVGVDGGEVRTIAVSQPELLASGWPQAVWSDGDTLLIGGRQGIYEVPATGGQLTPLTALQGDETLHTFPQLLPSRRGLLYNVLTRSTQGVPSDWAIVVRPLDGGEPRVLEHGSNPVYLPTGHIVFAREGALLAAPFDETTLELTAAPAVVLESVMQADGSISSSMNTGAAQFTVSRTGSLAYAPGGIYAETLLTRAVSVDLAGTSTDLGLPVASYRSPRVSPDGKRLSYVVGRLGGTQIWVYDLALGVPRALTSSGGHLSQIWSPDSTRLAYMRTDLDSRMFTLAIDGSAEPQSIGSGLIGVPLAWSRDDVLVFMPLQDATRVHGLWTLRLDGAAEPELFVAGNVGFATFSPDGKWLAYALAEAGRPEVYVRPYPGRTPVYRVSASGGIAPVWSPDGKRLFFQEPGVTEPDLMQQMVVDVTTEPSFEPRGRPRALFSRRYLITAPERTTDITPDGQFIMLERVAGPPNQPVTSIQLVQNWFAELDQLVPVPQR
jgi:Tol biopolymer transport system component